MTSIFNDDPFGKIKNEAADPSPPPREVNLFHSNADTDSSVGASHHTLGIKHNQAAAGDHVHDGISSRKLGYNQGLILTGAKGGNTALANLITLLQKVIDFTDSTT